MSTQETTTAEALAKAYVENENMLAEFKAARAKAWEAAIELQQRELAGTKGVSKDLSQKKLEVADLDLKIEAVRRTLQQLYKDLVAAIPAWLKAREKAITNAWSDADQKRKMLKQSFLSCMAKAFAIEEQIEGSYQGRVAKFEFDATKLLHEDRIFFMKVFKDEVERKGIGSEPHLNRVVDEIADELNGDIRDKIERQAYGEEAERLLSVYRENLTTGHSGEKEQAA